MVMEVPTITDEEFRKLCETWIRKSNDALDAARAAGTFAAKRDQAAPVYAAETLQVVWRRENDRLYHADKCREYAEYSRILAQEVAVLDARIRATLPPKVWYRVNGKGIMYEPGVATQVLDWEDVLEKVEFKQ
jgi:hypothetical protein